MPMSKPAASPQPPAHPPTISIARTPPAHLHEPEAPAHHSQLRVANPLVHDQQLVAQCLDPLQQGGR